MFNTEEVEKKGAASIVAYILIFYVGVVLVQLIISAIMGPITESNQYLANSLVNFVTYLILGGALIFINYPSLKSDLKTFMAGKSKIVTGILMYYFMTYILNIIANTLVLGVQNNMNLVNGLLRNGKFIEAVADNQNVIVSMLHSNGAFFMFVSAALIGPFCEEMVFRKSIFSLTKKPELGILISSFSFALIHLTSSFGSYSFIEILLMFIPYFVSGIAFSLIYIHSNYNIYYSMGCHMLMNIISMVVILIL